ncbi:hypothetical protein GCM10011371_03940 [Novosphingobium marinum]|uniref:EAL domain-containing protein (Putative c-di-GMP-specific phosphodiesterase class I) n=1 Tax=Novosphingobium marinum TaxID=1514948 RepID=A0A7Z0BRR4_9SPHN|nr:EAL domain-containing protein [Novosphingobium marinum]NYH94086.1 EAL domain-containing protein (putative c-di-GMP-specific phosphodiesterase class I) [Novosphingobium marinum]GGC19481.1 hypothetical protein GCM10011371_03940 [Novosphingobium marinum]
MLAYLKKPLVAALIFACLCGVLRLVEPLDFLYWNNRFRWFGNEAAPQSVVLVEIGDDDAAAGAPPVGKLFEKFNEMHPRRVYLDLGSDADTVSALAAGISALKAPLTIVARFESPDNFGADNIDFPNATELQDADIAISGWYTNFLGYALASPYEVDVDGRILPALAPQIAGRRGDAAEYFMPDFSMDPNSIPVISAHALIAGQVAPVSLADKNVVVVHAEAAPGRRLGYFGHGRISPVALDIAGSVGVQSGRSTNVGWIGLLCLFAGLAWGASGIASTRVRRIAYGAIVATCLVGPGLLQEVGLYSNVGPVLVALFLFGMLKLWSKWRRRVIETSASGLPNFVALAARKVPEGHDVVVATISRYEEFLATLPSSLHQECANQIARRFTVGSNATEVYHGDGGHFAWIDGPADTREQFDHFEGLRALFSAPLLIGDRMFDTNVHFGLDRNYEADTLTRLNMALASSTEALKTGQTVEQFESRRLADAPWELSLLARIDEGMRNGDIWLAYQPQWSFAEQQVCAAEALIRWNDPARGPISPAAFIVQAEKAGRIDALTYWVFEQAVSAAREFATVRPDFKISINLSAQLVDKASLISSISELSRKHAIDCRNFTIEVTETASVYNRPRAVENLRKLQAMGFRLAIDDFGTGEASLRYLAELPSNELKIDRSFISAITSNPRAKRIVASTISLAHDLGQTVVGEGIENESVFSMLGEMGCDVGQGYYIAHPQPIDQLRSQFGAWRQFPVESLGLVNRLR